MKRIIGLIIIWTFAATLVLSLPEHSRATGENATVTKSRQLYQAGDLDQALAVLRTFIQKTSGQEESAPAYALIGRILTRQHRYQDAILYLKRIPNILRTPESTLMLGAGLVQTTQYREGLALLQPLLDKHLDYADKITLFQNLTLAAGEEKQFLLALYYLQQQLQLNHQPATTLAQAHEILQNRIDGSALEEAAFMWQGTEIGQDAKLQLARRALVQQNPDDAREQLQQLLASPVMFPYWQEAELLLQRTNVDNWLNRDRIGVLLPLSGPYASYGELVKKGLELALQEHNKTRLPIRFIYRDTALEGVSSAQLVSTLSDDDKVMAIIGPLLAATAKEAAQRAQREMVPMLALSQADFLPEIGNFIFRDTLTAEQQVRALVDYALNADNISFSVLHPENRLGRQMSELFAAEVKKSGGEIIDIISYPEDSTDFRKQIQQLLWVKDKKSTETATTGEIRELEYPLAPFHALFLPDYADRISQLAPQLLFYGIKDVTLLGINGWNSPELTERSGRFLKNAIFVDAFSPASKKPEVSRFIELYRQNYKEEPTILGAQAFDAATLLLQIMDDPAVINRDNLRRKMTEIQDFQGVTGTKRFDPLGEAVKELSLLKIYRGRIVEN